jgi:hypothetical protein
MEINDDLQRKCSCLRKKGGAFDTRERYDYQLSPNPNNPSICRRRSTK